MGLLTVGTPLEWDEAKTYADLIRQKGINQFINLYNKVKDRKNDCLKWGDEVEFIIVKFDHVKKRVYLLLRGSSELLPILQGPQERGDKQLMTVWHPEYASYMLEGTPAFPYEHQIEAFNTLEANMGLRRKQAQQLLDKDEYVLSLTSFPRLGCPEYTWPNFTPTPNDGVTRSLFFVDQAINNGHPRFAGLSRNIRNRRKAKVAINVPVFVDANTPQPFVEDLTAYGDAPEPDTESKLAAKPNHIYMDAMGFGMGCCCLQMTFQAQSICEARHLYDQLTPLTPILLALSASSPIWKGYLADIDCRWNIISASCDDRTKGELGEAPLANDRYRIYKSRYDSVSSYLSASNAKYNDIPLVMDEKINAQLRDAGIDATLANHISHLFIRDPIVIFRENIDIDDEVETDHFENIQSTNWQTMRFKPPPNGSPIGWRVEFRPTELQITDFENAAFSTFVVLLTRAIMSFKLNMVMPISQVDVNMARAQKRNAALEQKFHFRTNIYTDNDPCSGEKAADGASDCSMAEMSVNEIVNGCEATGFPGMIRLIKEYLNNIEVDVDTQCTIKQYLKLIEMRANGKLMTTAAWMRKFVTSHPKYKQDSVVGDEINYDLMWRIHLISSGQIKCPELLPPYQTKSSIN